MEIQATDISLESGQDIVTRLVPLEEVPELVSQGKIKHSLVIVALYAFELWEKRQARG